MKQLKRTLSVLLLALCALVPALPAFAAQALVQDGAGLLSAEEARQLSAEAQAIQDDYGLPVYIVTVPAMSGESDAYAYATQLYDQGGFGAGAEHSGIMLLLSMQYRDYALIAHGEGNNVLTDYGNEKMADGFLDHFGEDDWYGGFSDFVSGCEWYLQHVAEGGEAGVPVHNEVEISDSTQEDTADDSFSLGGAFGLSLLISCVAALIVCMVFRSQMKSVRTQTTANQYVGNGGLNLTLSRDIYRYTSQKRRQIPRNDNNNNSTGGGHGGAGFSGSISHTSSSGHGRSGKF